MEWHSRSVVCGVVACSPFEEKDEAVDVWQGAEGVVIKRVDLLHLHSTNSNLFNQLREDLEGEGQYSLVSRGRGGREREEREG